MRIVHTRRLLGSALVLILSSLLGCSGGSTTSFDAGPCSPGESVACVGAGGCTGKASCNADGRSIGACSCIAAVDLAVSPDLASVDDLAVGDLADDLASPVMISINPTSATTGTSTTVQFVANVSGTSNRGVFFSIVEAAGGTVGSDGLYVAPAAPGDYHIVATSMADPAKHVTAVVHVDASVPVGITLGPPTAQLNAGQSQRFVAHVTGVTDQGVWYSVAEPGGGTIDSMGRYVASSTLGTYHVVATSMADPTKSATSSVTVTSTPQVAVSIGPSTAQVQAGAAQHFTATVTGTADTSVTWTASAGSVDATGLYTAPAYAGTYAVTATSNADSTKSDTATVTVPTVDVTGTIAYAGAKNGRVYIRLTGPNGGQVPIAGTSMDAPGPYTIRNVPNGSYTVYAWRDTLGVGKANAAADPIGTSAVVVAGSSMSGVDVTLTDPTPATPAPPIIEGVVPTSGAVLVLFSTPVDNAGAELADHYRLYCSTNPTPTAGNSTIRMTLAESGVVLLDGLTDGTQVYCAVSSIANGTEGAMSAVSGPVLVGNISGGHTLAGTVAFPSSINGPLYVFALSQSAMKGGLAHVADPIGPQSYTITGLADALYHVYAIFDRGDDGYLGPADPTTIGKGAPIILGTIAGADATAPAFAFSSSRVAPHILTFHDDGGYQLQVRVDSMLAQPTSVTLVSGPNVDTPSDIGLASGHDGPGGIAFYRDFALTTVPKVGDTYTFNVTYADGSHELIGASVTGVFVDRPAPLAPVGSVASVTTMSWSAPATSPGSYIYSLHVGDNAGPTVWELDEFSGALTSVTYGGSAVQSGHTYQWTISATDLSNNSCSADATFSIP